MAKPKEREVARVLYITGGYSQVEIADLLKVKPNTISEWVADGDWKTIKEKVEKGDLQLEIEYTTRLHALNEIINKKIEDSSLDGMNSMVDMEIKTLKARALVRNRVSFEGVVQTMKDFTSFISERDLTLSKRVMDEYANPFIKHVAKQYQ